MVRRQIVPVRRKKMGTGETYKMFKIKPRLNLFQFSRGFPFILLSAADLQGDRIIHYRSEPQSQLQPDGSNWSG